MNPQALANMLALAEAQLRGERLPPQPPQAMAEWWSQVASLRAQLHAGTAAASVAASTPMQEPV